MGFLIFCLIILAIVLLIARSRKAGVANSPLATQRIIDGLQLLIDRNETVSRAQLEELRDWAVGQSGVQPSSSVDVPIGSATHAGVNLDHARRGAPPKPLSQPIDNVNLLLFLGAFLLVVSAGIFVGVNYADLTGSIKTLFLAIFALTFYGTGMVLFRLNAKYRPAAVTFVGIGLVIVPLVGLALYNLVYDQQHGAAIWFGTSVVALVLYVYTLLVTRLTFVAYLMAAMVLSLFESTTWLAGLSVYWLSWGMAVTGLLLSLFARWRPLWKEATDSLAISAQIFLPVALMLSIGLAGDYGLGQVGVTLVLGALFYVLMAMARPRVHYADVYLVATLALLPAGIVTGLWDTIDRVWLGLVVILVAILYHLVARYGGRLLDKHEREITAIGAGITGLAAAQILSDRPIPLLVGLAITIVITLDLALILRQSAVAAVAILASLFVPLALARSIGYGEDYRVIATFFAMLVPFLFFLRLRMTDWAESGTAVGRAGYLLAAALTLATSAYAGALYGFIFALIVAVLLYGLNYLEKQRWLNELVGGIVTFALLWLWHYLGYSNLQVYTWTIAGFGAWMVRRYWQDTNARDLWLASTLAVITIPLAGQALSEDGQYYGLALIATAIAIVFVGMSLKSKLMIIWGSATLMGEVLYQMRDLLFAIPKYLISAVLGIVLIGVAIVVLRRRSND